MVVVKRVNKTKLVTKAVKKSLVSMNLSLPTEKSIPSNDLFNYTNLIFGKKKIGKTTLSSRFPYTIHFMFETGSKALAIFSRMVPSWEHFLGYINLLEKEEHNFKNAVIDTGDIAYRRCSEYICKREGIKHPSDKKDYGATWSMVSYEFELAHSRLMACGLGLIVISHEKVEEIETRNGDTFNQVVPSLSKQADTYYAGTMDNLFYYEYVGNERFLTIRGDEYVVAGTRCEKNFLTPDGEQIYRIPMGKSSEEAYSNLVRAFNNKQTKTYKPLVKREEEAEKPKTKVKKFKK